MDINFIFRVRPGEGPGAEVYTEMLQKNMSPYITTQVSGKLIFMRVWTVTH